VDAEQLRTRYRSLIRLTHPDMGVQGLPSSAAGMVNRAQEVLANPELRERYDQQLEGSPRPSWQGVPPPPAPAPSADDVRRMQRTRLDSPHHTGLAERWRALWARYPTQARLLLTATSVGVLVVGLLAWAAHDAPGGALVVARAPAQAATGPRRARRAATRPRRPRPRPHAARRRRRPLRPTAATPIRHAWPCRATCSGRAHRPRVRHVPRPTPCWPPRRPPLHARVPRRPWHSPSKRPYGRTPRRRPPTRRPGPPRAKPARRAWRPAAPTPPWRRAHRQP